VYAKHHFVTRIKVWLMPKRRCHHAWLHDNKTSRVNYTDKFVTIRTIAHVLVQSCQPYKHRQSVENTVLCRCVYSDGVSLLLYTLRMLWVWSITVANCTHIIVLPLCCGWPSVLMHNIRACFWVHSVLHKVWDWSRTTCGFTHSSVMPLRCGWAFELMHNIRACFEHIVHV
jgi:hypothetical protein